MGIAIVVAITFFIVGMMTINFIRDEVTTARLSDGLDCSNADVISDGTKLTCLAVDIVVPYFILLVLSGAVGWIVQRLRI
jgi:hypothetical protein|tara:strand:+ start:62 stop:301 length:240 start_codon:yes stop_codon:yes gene_type:complete